MRDSPSTRVMGTPNGADRMISGGAGEADMPERRTYRVTTRNMARRSKSTEQQIINHDGDDQSEPQPRGGAARDAKRPDGGQLSDRGSESSPNERSEHGRTQNTGEPNDTQTAFEKLAGIDVSDLEDARELIQ